MWRICTLILFLGTRLLAGTIQYVDTIKGPTNIEDAYTSNGSFSYFYSVNHGGSDSLKVNASSYMSFIRLTAAGFAEVHGATIDSTTLCLIFLRDPTTARTVSLFHIFPDWKEGTGSSDADSGTVSSAGAQEITYNKFSGDASSSDSNWNTPGAFGSGTDRAASATTTITIDLALNVGDTLHLTDTNSTELALQAARAPGHRGGWKFVWNFSGSFVLGSTEKGDPYAPSVIVFSSTTTPDIIEPRARLRGGICSLRLGGGRVGRRV